MGRNKQVSCKICFKSVRSDHLNRHMKVHIIYTSPEVQTENSEEICKDIVNDIVNKMFEQNAATERKHDEDDNQSAAKRKYNEIDDDELEKDMIKDNEGIYI